MNGVDGDAKSVSSEDSANMARNVNASYITG